MDHLVKISVLPDNQSAYRQFYSTETSLCAITSDIISLMDSGNCAVLILLDLSAAFDTVVHDLLFDDLKSIGITQAALQYLKSYLLDRVQIR